MRHSWQLLEKVHGSHHIDICMHCGLTRKAKKNNHNEYLTQYSGGYQAYRHVPPCEGVWEDAWVMMKEHDWKDLEEYPWQKCERCGALKLCATTTDRSIVWFNWDNKQWTRDYRQCTNG